jgi:hypothetical protein
MANIPRLRAVSRHCVVVSKNIPQSWYIGHIPHTMSPMWRDCLSWLLSLSLGFLTQACVTVLVFPTLNIDLCHSHRVRSSRSLLSSLWPSSFTAFQRVLHYGDENCPTCTHMSTAWTLKKIRWSMVVKFWVQSTATFCSWSLPASSCSQNLHSGRLYCQPIIIRLFLFDPHKRDQRRDWKRNQLCRNCYISTVDMYKCWYFDCTMCTHTSSLRVCDMGVGDTFVVFLINPH